MSSRVSADPIALRTARVTLIATEQPWSFPASAQSLIDAHWARSVAANPKYFNGVVYTLTELAIEPSHVSATLAPIAFREFLYWREGGRPDVGLRDGFGAAILRSKEGHVLLCRAAPGMLNHGRYTFVSGFIDLNDRRPDGTIDLDASTRRELREETGLGRDDLTAEPGYVVVNAGGVVMFAVVYRSELDATTLRERILAFARTAEMPEIDDVMIVASPNALLLQQLQPVTAVALQSVLGFDVTSA
jgi:predicted NUDIX family NTP pyrophosphohydrolase